MVKLEYWLLILLGVIFFGWLQWSEYFVDPDAFYHARLSARLLESGWKINFEWLPFTQLNDLFTDHHLLYHLLISPLTYWLEPWLALKVVTVGLLTGLALVFYWFLRKHQVPWPGLYLGLLFTNFPFLFRLNLGKSVPLVLIFLLVAIYYWWRQKFWPLLLVAAAGTWTYAGWLLIIFLFGWDWWLKDLWPSIKNKYFSNKIVQNFSENNIFNCDQLKIWLAVFIGLALGLITHPYWPDNLRFYYEQIWQIALLGSHYHIGVGSEWYPYDIYQILRHFVLLEIFLGIGIFAAFVQTSKLSVQTKWLGGVTLFCLLLSLRSVRYVEYLAPFLVLLVAFLYRDVDIKSSLSDWAASSKRVLSRRVYLRQLGRYIFVVGWLVILLVAGHDVWATKRQLERRFPITTFAAAANYLATHTTAGEIIFHSDWDTFPVLWYHNQSNRYVAGLDPTFYLRAKNSTFELWSDITAGELADNLTAIVRDKFQAQYIFVEADRKKMKENFLLTGEWEVVFADTQVSILKLRAGGY